MKIIKDNVIFKPLKYTNIYAHNTIKMTHKPEPSFAINRHQKDLNTKKHIIVTHRYHTCNVKYLK